MLATAPIQAAAIEASRIGPKLYQGSKPPKGDALRKAGFKVLVLCAEELDLEYGAGDFPGVTVVWAGIDDAVLQPREWDTVLAAGKRVAHEVSKGRRTLVVCQQGRNRSGIVCAVALHLLTRAPGRKIIRHIKKHRRAPNGEALTNDDFNRVIATTLR